MNFFLRFGEFWHQSFAKFALQRCEIEVSLHLSKRKSLKDLIVEVLFRKIVVFLMNINN